MNQFMNKIISGMLTFSACCFLLVSISHVSATANSIKEFSSHADKYLSEGKPGFFDSPSDIVLNSEGTLALITSSSERTGSDRTSGAITRCTVDGDEGFSECTHSVKSSEPGEFAHGLLGLAFNPAYTFIFVTSNYQKTTSDTVWRCSFDTDKVLNLTDCQPALANSIYHFNGTDGIAINIKGNFAYIVDNNVYPPNRNLTNFKVSRCGVNVLTGVLSSCTDVDILGLNYPSGIAINASGTLAFITNSGGSDEKFNNPNTVFRCFIDPKTGILTNCDNTGGTGFSLPSRITLNNRGTHAYVANRGSNDITRCNIDKAGKFSDCKATGTGFHNPSAIVLNKENTVAFITNFSDGTVSRCLVDEGGDFSGCRDALYHVSVMDSKQHSVSFLNLSNLKDTPAITVKNTGGDLNHFHLDALSLQYASLDKDNQGGNL